MSHRTVPLKLAPAGLACGPPRDRHWRGSSSTYMVHAADEHLSGMRSRVLLGSQPLWTNSRRSPGPRSAAQDPFGSPAFSMSELRVRTSDLHGAVSPGSHPGSRSTHLSPRRAHPCDRPRPRRPSRRKAHWTPLHAGRRRHAAAPPAAARGTVAIRCSHSALTTSPS